MTRRIDDQLGGTRDKPERVIWV